jgi:hypothetical protein
MKGNEKEEDLNGNGKNSSSADDASDSEFDLIYNSTKNLLEKIKSLMTSNKLNIDSISPEEFEKDND